MTSTAAIGMMADCGKTIITGAFKALKGFESCAQMNADQLQSKWA